ncbi:MAG: hypothetical protein V1784_06380 [bacterium]
MRSKHLFILALLVSIAMAATLSAAPRYRERRSTKDLERVDVKGKIERIEGRKATLRTDTGRRVTVHLGPQWYWRDRNYRLDRGAHVEVRGYGEVWDDEGGFVYPYEIEGEDFAYDFADEYGYPRWAPDDEYYDGWYPTIVFYNDYFYCPPPPPPPRWYWHQPRHHYGPRYGHVWSRHGGWNWRPCRPHFGIRFGFWWR